MIKHQDYSLSLESLLKAIQNKLLRSELRFFPKGRSERGKKTHTMKKHTNIFYERNIFSMKYFVCVFHFDTGKERSEVTQNTQFILKGLRENVRAKLYFSQMGGCLNDFATSCQEMKRR